MFNCPICDSESNEGQETCFTCSYPLNVNGDSQFINSELVTWARKLWQENNFLKKKQEKYDSTITQDTSNEFLEKIKIELFTPLQDRLQVYNERLDRLEKSEPTDQSLSFRLDSLQEQVNCFISERENGLINIQRQVAQIHHEQSQIENQWKKLTDNLSITQNQLNEMQDRLEELKYNIELNNSINNSKSARDLSQGSTDTYQSVGSTIEIENFSSMENRGYIGLEESRLVKRYNRDLSSFSQQYVEEVNATEESLNNLRIGSNSSVIFERKRRGNYWIVKENGYEYLVPSNNLRLNQHNYKTVEDLFECINFKLDSNFQLVKPARVSPLPGGETWQLEERGILQF
ncbi:hypothetical protein V0288_04795 [Pannus brasiliensis CCIBt3594]|uniref:Uncharacterized protein n=1 Tax=Pannus brasiliensis CCIBt3594 TaxID=1427578 RepID=A0AAW9QMQ6_9CHRO